MLRMRPRHARCYFVFLMHGTSRIQWKPCILKLSNNILAYFCSHAYCTTVQRLLLSAKHSYRCSPTTLSDHKDQQGLKKPIWAKPDGSFASRFCYRAKPDGQDATRFCYPWQLDDPKGQEGARGAKPDGPFASRFCYKAKPDGLDATRFCYY